MLAKKFIDWFTHRETNFPPVTGEAMNEKPIGGKYSEYADAYRERADIDYVRRRFAFTGMKRGHFIEMRFFP